MPDMKMLNMKMTDQNDDRAQNYRNERPSEMYSATSTFFARVVLDLSNDETQRSSPESCFKQCAGFIPACAQVGEFWP